MGLSKRGVKKATKQANKALKQAEQIQGATPQGQPIRFSSPVRTLSGQFDAHRAQAEIDLENMKKDMGL